MKDLKKGCAILAKKCLIKDTELNTVIDIFAEKYPETITELNHSNPFELLIATMLSAQCTDVRVNIVTEELFKKLKTPEDFAVLTPEELSPYIKTCGLYKTKSKNIVNACKLLLEDFNGEVPQTHEELMSLPGVGRKTANVVLSNAFGIPAIAVDTHVFRVTNRIGIVNADDVSKTEKQLMERMPEKIWSDAHHWFIYHGRRVCKARKPLCEECDIKNYCCYYSSLENKGGDL